jgi:hypothetical protein
MAALLDEYAEHLQRRVGEDMVLQRSDAVRMVLGRVLRKWKSRRRKTEPQAAAATVRKRG